MRSRGSQDVFETVTVQRRVGGPEQVGGNDVAGGGAGLIDTNESGFLCRAGRVGADPSDQERRGAESKCREVEAKEERADVGVGPRQGVKESVTDLHKVRGESRQRGSGKGWKHPLTTGGKYSKAKNSDLTRNRVAHHEVRRMQTIWSAPYGMLSNRTVFLSKPTSVSRRILPKVLSVGSGRLLVHAIMDGKKRSEDGA